MNLTQGFAAVALLAAWSAANAGGFSATVTGTTDYDFRGVTQTANNPALQASVDFAADNGFYAGVWSSNVDFGGGDPNVEIDLYGGWTGGETYPWDLGITYYTYVNCGSCDYPEAHLGVGWKYFGVKAWYSWNYAGISGTNEKYYEGNFTYPLPANFGLTAHAGYSNGSGIRAAYGQGSYMDWSAGLTYSWSHFNMSLKWIDGSDLQTQNNSPHDISSSDARAVFQISTTFPWKKEE